MLNNSLAEQYKQALFEYIYISFEDHRPDRDNTVIPIHSQNEHIYKFWKPKLNFNNNKCFIKIYSKKINRIDIKYTFSDP